MYIPFSNSDGVCFQLQCGFFSSLWDHSDLNAWVLPADRAGEHLSALQTGLSRRWLLGELCWSEVAGGAASVVELYRKNVLLSAFILLCHAGKCIFLRAGWCLGEGCFCGWLTGFMSLFLIAGLSPPPTPLAWVPIYVSREGSCTAEVENFKVG